jgi:hypothetical protein
MIYTATLKNNPYSRICGWIGLDIAQVSMTVMRNENTRGHEWHCIMSTKTDTPDPLLLETMGDEWKPWPEDQTK